MTEEKEYRLPREFGEKWLKALRSGEYEQAKEILCEINKSGNKSFCCLGVAAYINYTEKHLEKTDFFNHGLFNKYLDLKKIPKELKGDTCENDLVEELVDMNDNGHSFEHIADWIEDNIEFYDKV